MITLEQVLKAYEYANDHPHKYLRGTSNWCAAVAHSLNEQQPAIKMHLNVSNVEVTVNADGSYTIDPGKKPAPVAADLVHDRAYRDGLKRGFGLGENGQAEQYHKEFSAYQNGIVGAEKEQPAPVAAPITDEQILEAMRPAIYAADGGYVFDTAKDDVIASGRALLAEVARLNGVKP